MPLVGLLDPRRRTKKRGERLDVVRKIDSLECIEISGYRVHAEGCRVEFLYVIAYGGQHHSGRFVARERTQTLAHLRLIPFDAVQLLHVDSNDVFHVFTRDGSCLALRLAQRARPSSTNDKRNKFLKRWTLGRLHADVPARTHIGNGNDS